MSLDDNKSKKLKDMSREERQMRFRTEIRASEDEFLSNAILVSAVDHKIVDVRNEAQQDYLISAYQEAKDRAGASYSTLIKAIFKQNRAFFACTQADLIKIMQLDPDNTMDSRKLLKISRGSGSDGNSNPVARMDRVSKYWKNKGVHMLWASKGLGMAAGFVVTNPTVLELLGFTSDELKQQYKDLQKFTKYLEVPMEWVFDDGGDIKLQIEKIRNHTVSANQELINLKKTEYLSSVDVSLLSNTANMVSAELIEEIELTDNSRLSLSQEDLFAIQNFQSLIIPEIEDSSNNILYSNASNLYATQSASQIEHIRPKCFIGRTKTTTVIDCIVQYYKSYRQTPELDFLVKAIAAKYHYEISCAIPEYTSENKEDFFEALFGYISKFKLNDHQEQDIVYIFSAATGSGSKFLMQA